LAIHLDTAAFFTEEHTSASSPEHVSKSMYKKLALFLLDIYAYKRNQKTLLYV